MRMTTLCYIEKDDSYLMIHRTKKENDQSHDKWLGVGGKFEEDESPEDCMLREVYEETGLRLTEFTFNGIVTFLSDTWETEYMYLFTATKYEGELIDCNEGDLEWVKKEDILKLNIWEGDKLFLKLLMEKSPFFSMKLIYEGYKLINNEIKLYEQKA